MVFCLLNYSVIPISAILIDEKLIGFRLGGYLLHSAREPLKWLVTQKDMGLVQLAYHMEKKRGFKLCIVERK